MNILYLTQVESINYAGGTQVYSMASGLARLGHNVKLICKDRKAPGEIVRGVGNGTLSIRKIKGSGRFHALLYPLQLLFYGARYIATSKIDVIYERASSIPLGFLFSKFFRKPLVVAIQGLQYYEYDSETRSSMVRSKLLARRTIANKVLANRFVMAIFKRIAKFNYKNATWIITVTPQIKKLICAQYKIDPDKVIVIPNGADIDLFKPIEKNKAKSMLKLCEDAQYICFVGHLYFTQGVECLVKSAPLISEKCPSARFLIVGDGPSKGELMNLAQQIGVSAKFVFTGAVPHEDVPMYINGSEVCLCTARNDTRNRIEGSSSLKILEYMACGKPLVVGNAEGNKDVIAESNAGLVVRPEHSHEMASAIIKLLKDKQLNQRLGENGRKAVIERYSSTSVAQRVAETFEKAIKR
jgi:glycosyltransferase involved in cell wall biosynthesis